MLFVLGSKTFCVLAEEASTVRVNNIILCESHNVVRTSWFVSKLTLDASELPRFTPEVLLGMSATTREELSKSFDEYGDHYVVPSSRGSIKHPLEMAEKKVREIKILQKAILSIK